MVLENGLKSLDICSKTSDYFHMIPMTFQMLKLNVALFELFTFISSKFGERWEDIPTFITNTTTRTCQN